MRLGPGHAGTATVQLRGTRASVIRGCRAGGTGQFQGTCIIFPERQVPRRRFWTRPGRRSVDGLVIGCTWVPPVARHLPAADRSRFRTRPPVPSHLQTPVGSSCRATPEAGWPRPASGSQTPDEPSDEPSGFGRVAGVLPMPPRPQRAKITRVEIVAALTNWALSIATTAALAAVGWFGHATHWTFGLGGHAGRRGCSQCQRRIQPRAVSTPVRRSRGRASNWCR